MTTKAYGFTSLTGGGIGALDSIDGASLAEGDIAIGADSSDAYMFRLNATSGAAEASPEIISPDSNAGNKRWIRKHDGTKVDGTASIVSVLDYSTVQDAIDACVLSGDWLYWPAGEYAEAASLDDLHSVKHLGPGYITRGTDTFYVAPNSSQTNTLYASVTGDAGNDGLTSSEPLTVQAALTALANYGPMLDGKWDISLAAGTYTETNILFPIGLQSKYPIFIYGPDVSGHPNIPTAIFDGDETSNYAFRLRNGTSAFFQDIKFLDFTGGGGIAATNFCLLATKNVHGTNCYDTILSYQGRLYVSGGVFELAVGNYSAIKSMFNDHHNIGFLYNRDTGLHATDGDDLGPDISSVAARTARGVHVQENSTGHVEGLVVDNVTKGIEIIASSRANVAISDFTNCGVAIEVEAGSNIYDAGTNTFGTGADENDQTFKFLSGGVETGAFSDSIAILQTHRLYTGGSEELNSGDHTGDTNETPLFWIEDFLDTHEFGRFGMIRVRVMGTFTGTAGDKTIRLRLGDSGVTYLSGELGPSMVFPSAGSGTFICELTLICTGDDAQYCYGWGITGAGGAAGGVVDMDNSAKTMDINDGAANGCDLVISGQLGNGGDTIDVDMVEVWRGGS